jgi:hypothetical protein
VQTPTLYETLFGDLPLERWAAYGARIEAEPWHGFSRALAHAQTRGIARACTELHAITRMPDLETRHYLQAWNGLRQFNCPEARQAERVVLGVVIEAAATEDDGRKPVAGHDILAAYADRSAYYLDHSGVATVWLKGQDADDALDDGIAAVLAAATAILPQTGPWQGDRLPPPVPGNVRINLLTPVGLCFGEGPFAAIARDPAAGPLVQAAAILVQRLAALPKATVN